MLPIARARTGLRISGLDRVSRRGSEAHVLTQTRPRSRSGPALNASSTSNGGGGLYPLPSDGWEQGDISATAVVAGALHVTVTSDGACAWVGEHGSAVLWPAGYQVQGATLEIIDEAGTAVAREGDYVPAAGGLYSATPNLAFSQFRGC